jgi:hypothetical protein
VTPSGIVTALLLNVAIVVTSLLLRGERLVAATIAPDLAFMLLAMVALAALAAAVHAERWPSNCPSRQGPQAEWGRGPERRR